MATTRHHLNIRRPFRCALLVLVTAASFFAAPAAHAASFGGGSYGWPVKPFDRQHPVRGFFGDPRIGMTPEGMTSTFHFGIDISAPDGTPVYATLTGTVVLESVRPETVVVVGTDGHTGFEYWHVVPSVRSGEHVVAYETLVGHISKGWAHVHFSEVQGGRYVNPLRRGALGPYADDTHPRVTHVTAERDGKPMQLAALHGHIDLVAEAADETPLAVPAPWANKPVAPALLRFRLCDSHGRAVTSWHTAIDFRRTIPPNSMYGQVYARWTRQNSPWGRRGRYRFYLAHGWNTRALRDGSYTVEVDAGDTRGNSDLARFDVRISNSGL